MLTEEEILVIWAEHGSTIKCLRAIEQETAKRCVDLALVCEHWREGRRYRTALEQLTPNETEDWDEERKRGAEMVDRAKRLEALVATILSEFK